MAQQSSESVVRTVGLTKVFRDFWLREKVTAVDGLDMDIRPKEVFGLLGPNGSGKSTTLKMILGLLFPTKGSISIFGQPPTNVAVKARIGFLPEESHLYPFLDARETLDFYGRLFQLSHEDRTRRIDMLLDMVGLSSVAYRRVGEYSKGMQRRIGLAQALINDPDLLILDEPTSGLDPLGTRQFKDLIRTLADRGKTVILSSHLLGDVEDVCDRVCVLYGGKRRALGPIDELLAQKERTQITTGPLDESTLRAIEKLLADAGNDVVDVSHPRDRLESMFLRIVDEARQQQVRTGGAQGGGRVAEFLTQHDSGADLIESLVQTATEPETEVPPSDEDTIGQVDAQVLDTLVAETPPAEKEQAATSKESAAKSQADQSVLKELLGGGADQTEGESK